MKGKASENTTEIEERAANTDERIERETVTRRRGEMIRSTNCRRVDTPGPFAPIARRAFTPQVANSGTRSQKSKDCRASERQVRKRRLLCNTVSEMYNNHCKFVMQVPRCDVGGEDASRAGDGST